MKSERLAEHPDRVFAHFIPGKKLRPHLREVQPQLFVSSDLRSVIRDVLLKRQLGSFFRFGMSVYVSRSSFSPERVHPHRARSRRKPGSDSGPLPVP